ncbi:hypothetical protein C2I18_14425 [Paenibacillus sp. PK3_47]|uniref:hypothetical protein n=1 Tax=Paenibacillus sp. PK3_47 TaxID=2072642 RepID=UPI00201D9C3C|nr:hypothetical protein [Paenibacillus sp. PK3_47]UQZ34614.1 hypothetical protein C2I18_14425 [Paenibacillus sp. PK3_47]
MADVIKQLLLEKLINNLSGHIKGAWVNIGGVQTAYPIYNTIVSGMTVRKYIYITETQAVGKQLLGAALLDVDGNILADQPLTVIKNDKGFLIAFEFILRLEASAGGV